MIIYFYYYYYYYFLSLFSVYLAYMQMQFVFQDVAYMKWQLTSLHLKPL